MDEIALLDPINHYISDHGEIQIMREVSAIVIANVNGRKGCFLHYFPGESLLERFSDYTLIHDGTFEYWKDGHVKKLADLNERKIWAIIYKWLRSHRQLLKPKATV